MTRLVTLLFVTLKVAALVSPTQIFIILFLSLIKEMMSRLDRIIYSVVPRKTDNIVDILAA